MPESEGMTITRVFNAPRQLVFDAWTDPIHFAHWWGGTTVEVPADSVSMDVRPGGSWKATMVLGGGHQIHWLGEYVEVDPPNRLVLTLSDGSGDGTARETVTVDLTEVAGGTQMVCHQGGLNLSPEQYEQTREGYQQFFNAMEEIFEAAA